MNEHENPENDSSVIDVTQTSTEQDGAKEGPILSIEELIQLLEAPTEESQVSHHQTQLLLSAADEREQGVWDLGITNAAQQPETKEDPPGCITAKSGYPVLAPLQRMQLDAILWEHKGTEGAS